MARSTASIPAEAGHADRVLRYAATAYAVGFVFHNADHVRRGLDVVTRHVLWGGVALGVASAFALAMVAVRHPLAPRVAAAVGFGAALGVTAAHLLPAWGAFSDSLPDGNADGVSWAAVPAEIAGALALGVAGLRTMGAEAASRAHR